MPTDIELRRQRLRDEILAFSEAHLRGDLAVLVLVGLSENGPSGLISVNNRAREVLSKHGSEAISRFSDLICAANERLELEVKEN